ncbi:hypothetical protein SEPCBS57363_004613 [Sporothrix epigloea]|uniref:BZIP transcription factor n=1 Tax=Sporothrix epigloea TaxID=1892477 RepID=A0ABP0DT56_9PEZI
MTASTPSFQRHATGNTETMDEDLHIRPVKTDGRSSTRASSRAAANLSMERLYRKRAIDRENQRILRQKNKARLVELETEVRSLTEQLAQAEADRATAAERTQISSTTLGSIISSLQSLQVTLASVAATSSLSVKSTDSEGSRTPRSPPASRLPGTRHTGAAQQSTASASASPASARGYASEDQPMTGTEQSRTSAYKHMNPGESATLDLERLDSWSPGAPPTVPVNDGPHEDGDLLLEIDLLTQSLPLFASDDRVLFPAQLISASGQTRASSPTQPHPHLHSQVQTQLQPLRPLRPPADQHGQGILSWGKSGSRSPPSKINSQAPPAPLPVVGENRHDEIGAVYLARVEANRLRDESPIWAATPAYVPPTTDVDKRLFDVLRKRKHGSRSGRQKTVDTGTASAAPVVTVPTTTAVNTPFSTTTISRSSSSAPSHSDDFTHAHFPSVTSLLNPELREPEQPAAFILAHHVASTLLVYTTPERLALLYMMRIYTRWLIAPTHKNYDSIPEFFRPTASQLVVPHPSWIDTLGWPRARERLINHFDYTRYHDFASTISKFFSINWPHPALEGILENSTGGSAERSAEQSRIMTQAFVQHVRQPKNWTVGPELIKAFPFLEGAVNVRGRPPVSL